MQLLQQANHQLISFISYTCDGESEQELSRVANDANDSASASCHGNAHRAAERQVRAGASRPKRQLRNDTQPSL